MEISVEFEKYKLIREFERANRPLSVVEKDILTAYSLDWLEAGLNAIVKDEWNGRK